jgi:hypothetical protein
MASGEPTAMARMSIAWRMEASFDADGIDVRNMDRAPRSAREARRVGRPRQERVSANVRFVVAAWRRQSTCA